MTATIAHTRAGTTSLEVQGRARDGSGVGQ